MSLVSNIFRAGTIALFLSTLGAAAATITIDIEDVPKTTLFGQLTYEGSAGDILGFYDGATSTSLAERFDSGNNSDEENLVATLTGLSMVNLGGTELPITGSSASIAANTFFTAKFAKSIAVFHNITDSAILVTFDSSNSTCTNGKNGNANQCGGISHYKAISDGTTLSSMPLPAGVPLVLTALGAFGVLRLRSRKGSA